MSCAAKKGGAQPKEQDCNSNHSVGAAAGGALGVSALRDSAVVFVMKAGEWCRLEGGWDGTGRDGMRMGMGVWGRAREGEAADRGGVWASPVPLVAHLSYPRPPVFRLP